MNTPINSADLTSTRQLAIARAAELGLTPSELARRSGGWLHQSTIHRYFTGERDLTGGRLDILLPLLGLEIRPKKTSRKNAN